MELQRGGIYKFGNGHYVLTEIPGGLFTGSKYNLINIATGEAWDKNMTKKKLWKTLDRMHYMGKIRDFNVKHPSRTKGKFISLNPTDGQTDTKNIIG